MTLSSYLPLEPTFITPGVLPLWLDVGGGIIADLLTGVKPDVMSRGPWSASMALVSACWSIIWFEQGFVRFAEISSIALCVLLRGMAIWRGWEAPHADHLKPNTWIKRKS